MYLIPSPLSVLLGFIKLRSSLRSGMSALRELLDPSNPLGLTKTYWPISLKIDIFLYELSLDLVHMSLEVPC